MDEDLQSVASTKSVYYKTTNIFAEICQRRLWLRDTGKTGPAQTNGHEIQVPLLHPDAYVLLEHEIAHILFKSDLAAKTHFIALYSEKAAKAAQSFGVKLDQPMLARMLDHIINTLEDYRIESLWGLLYRGSAKLMHKRRVEAPLPNLDPNRSVQDILLAVLCERNVPPGALSRFEPLIKQALAKVYRRGFRATLITSKWLVVQFITELIRAAAERKRLQAPSMRGGQPQSGDDQPDADDSDTGNSDASDSGSTDDPGDADSSGSDTGETDEDSEEGSDGSDFGEGSDEDGEDTDSGTGSGADSDDADDHAAQTNSADSNTDRATPDEEDARTRAEALQALLKHIDSSDVNTQAFFTELNDCTEAKFQSRTEKQEAQDTAQQALNSDVADMDRMDAALQQTVSEMAAIIRNARSHLRAQKSADEHLLQDIPAKVILTDVSASDILPSCICPLTPEDRDTIRRLRATFERIRLRRKVAIQDTGTELDVTEYIQNKLSGNSNPCFRVEESGQGFRTLVLLDRSGSMEGARTLQATRCSRILQQALKAPGVQYTLWGFTSSNPGQVDISRYAPDVPGLDTRKGASYGCTPLHLAIRLAIRELEQGTEIKQLVVVTDGQPVYARRDGKSFQQAQLAKYIREDVQYARNHGINVTCVLIDDIFAGDKKQTSAYYRETRKNMDYMFGHGRHWYGVSAETFGRDLQHLISTSFIQYLRR